MVETSFPSGFAGILKGHRGSCMLGGVGPRSCALTDRPPCSPSTRLSAALPAFLGFWPPSCVTSFYPRDVPVNVESLISCRADQEISPPALGICSRFPFLCLEGFAATGSSRSSERGVLSPWLGWFKSCLVSGVGAATLRCPVGPSCILSWAIFLLFLAVGSMSRVGLGHRLFRPSFCLSLPSSPLQPPVHVFACAPQVWTASCTPGLCLGGHGWRAACCS